MRVAPFDRARAGTVQRTAVLPDSGGGGQGDRDTVYAVYTTYWRCVMSSVVRFESTREVRSHLKDWLDAATEGRPAVVQRDAKSVAAVDAQRLVSFLITVRPLGARVVAEGEGWSIFVPGLPVAADGATLDEAVDEMVGALRDYAEAWSERLRLTPNHADNWGLVQIISLADDDQLRGWVTG